MKLLRLEILNLASLDRQGGETINFEEGALGDSTIFSIVGPTGSGKSTILDAICLALYNRAPRYPRKKGDRNQNIEIFGDPEDGERNRPAPTDCKNILTRGKKDGYSKLTFCANNGNIYRAEWNIHKKVKEIADPVCMLYSISTENGQTKEEVAEWEKLPQIIGLDYEQFLRTVLLAQGSFANFLTAKEEERYQLLEKLIGCGALYSSIAEGIKQRKDDADEAYKVIAAEFAAHEKDLIPEEELTPLKERICHLEAEEKQAKAELSKVTEALTWYATEERHVENIRKYTEAFTSAESNLNAIKPQVERLALHDATLDAVSLYKDMTTAARNIAQCDKALKEIQAKITRNEAQIAAESDILSRLQKAAQEAANVLEQQKPHINRAREIKAAIDALAPSINEKKKAWDNYQADFAKASKSVRNKDLINAEAQNAYEKQKVLWEQRNRQNEDELKSEALSTTQLQKELDTLNRTLTLMTSNDWNLHRQRLADGDRCPLCGSKDHPYKKDEEYQAAESELQKLCDEKQTELNRRNCRKEELLNQLKATDPMAVLVETLRLSAEAFKKKELAQQAESVFKLASKEIEDMQNALKAEIGDKDPDTCEKALTKAKDDAAKAVDGKANDIVKLREELKGLQGKEQSTKEQIQAENDKQDNASKSLSDWLNEYNKDGENLTADDVAGLYATTDNWEAMRANQMRLKDALTSASTTLQNEAKAHEEHQAKKPEQAKEELSTRRAELESISNTELVDSKARIQRHEAAKQLMGAKFEQKQLAERDKQEWAQISDAIGGADGKTMRKIAQCYTLRFLIEHANVEIRKFNSRYELMQVKNSLGIRVIDHDRADDVRDTTSLSGGETFIVSLGLALGLSALSSRNISFGNLFIDEGFGTLDPDTLATVIDSLAMLQSSQGKKVGVISHTDTMSERITTQIRIIKNGNSGSSHIEIYP